ncbi:MAG: hypothetical protein ACMUEM_02055 [Flavobacteriales bacterium AspAUS03]
MVAQNRIPKATFDLLFLSIACLGQGMQKIKRKKAFVLIDAFL